LGCGGGYEQDLGQKNDFTSLVLRQNVICGEIRRYAGLRLPRSIRMKVGQNDLAVREEKDERSLRQKNTPLPCRGQRTPADWSSILR
jgi:hypothetical protein